MKSTKAFAIALLGTTLALTIYSCKDMGDTPPRQIPLLTANQTVVTLAPGAQTTLTISGGNPPYRISRQADTLIAKATLAGTALTLQAAPANLTRSTSVKIMDTDPSGTIDSPTHEEQEIEIQIHVSANVVLFGAHVQPILTANCAVSGCHVTGGSGPMTLTSGTSRGNLVDVSMLNSVCGGKRVVIGDANASGLVKKLEGSCGNRMPLGSGPLPVDQIRLIRDWIDQGAQNN